MEDKKSIAKKIYVDLDSLFDTRLSTIETIDSKLATAIYSNRLFYDSRLIDEFDYLTNNIFKRFYRERNNRVFFKALPTNIPELLLTDIGYIIDNKHLTDESKPITIICDTSKYNLSDEYKDKIKSYLERMINTPYVNIIADDFSLMNKSPDYIDSEFLSIYMYDGIKWLNEYMMLWNPDELTINMPNTRLMVPALFDKPIVLKKVSDYIDILEDTSKNLRSVIDLNYIDVKYFNFVNK